MANIPLPKADTVVTIDLSDLESDDMRVGDKWLDMVDASVEKRSDDGGNYAYIAVKPRGKAPDSVVVIVGLPQIDFTDGMEWYEIDVQGDLSRLHIGGDCRDRDATCFSVGAHGRITSLGNGWHRFRGFLVGKEAERWKGEDLRRDVRPPVRLKWLLLTALEGEPTTWGIRNLRIKPLK